MQDGQANSSEKQLRRYRDELQVKGYMVTRNRCIALQQVLLVKDTVLATVMVRMKMKREINSAVTR